MSLTPAQEEEVQSLVDLVDHDRLTEWEKNFLMDLGKQYEERGSETIVSAKMWTILNRISNKIYG